VPYEVRQVVEKYWSARGKVPIERLAPEAPERSASNR
jgi:hypothetical protein